MVVSVAFTFVVVVPTWVSVTVPPVAKVPVGEQLVATANAPSNQCPAPGKVVRWYREKYA